MKTSKVLWQCSFWCIHKLSLWRWKWWCWRASQRPWAAQEDICLPDFSISNTVEEILRSRGTHQTFKEDARFEKIHTLAKYSFHILVVRTRTGMCSHWPDQTMNQELGQMVNWPWYILMLVNEGQNIDVGIHVVYLGNLHHQSVMYSTLALYETRPAVV